MIKGIYTIEKINKNTGEKQLISKENAIHPMYKKFYEIEAFPGRFTTTLFHSYIINPTRIIVIPRESDTPLTNESGDIILSSSIQQSSYTNGFYSSSPLIYTQCQKYITLTLNSRELDITAKHIYFSTGYVSGPFTIPGIMMYWVCVYATKATNPSYYAESRIFSASDLEIPITVESNEQVKFYYELIQEWE